MFLHLQGNVMYTHFFFDSTYQFMNIVIYFECYTTLITTTLHILI